MGVARKKRGVQKNQQDEDAECGCTTENIPVIINQCSHVKIYILEFHFNATSTCMS